VWFKIAEDRIMVQPANALAYYPSLPEPDEETDSAFSEAETLEFHDHRPDEAETIYRHLAESPQADIRAGALVRLGRVLRVEGRPEEALRAFARLAALSDGRADQLPAELVARESRCRILAVLNRRPELEREASLLPGGTALQSLGTAASGERVLRGRSRALGRAGSI